MQNLGGASPIPLWISETDERGNRVSREVIESAHRIWNRVLYFLRRENYDLAPAAEILEAVCHSVSRVARRREGRGQIRDLDSYLYWAFVRRYYRRRARDARIRYVGSVETFTEGWAGPDESWVAMLEDDIRLKQFLACLEPKFRVMLIRRFQGDRWAEIGQMFGISAHNAEVQFANAIKKARRRLFGGSSKARGQGKL